MFSRKLLSLVIVLILLLGTVFPASAIDSNSDAENTNLRGQLGNSISTGGRTDKDNGAFADTHNMNSIIVPLTFDGSIPDISQVKVNNRAAEPAPMMMRSFGLNAAESDDNAPKKVETDVLPLPQTQNGLEGIKLITADKYFEHTRPDGVTERQFFAIFNKTYPKYAAKFVSAGRKTEKRTVLRIPQSKIFLMVLLLFLTAVIL